MNPFRLRIEDDRLKAYLTVVGAEVDDRVTPEMIASCLKENGVVFGVDADAVGELVNNRRWDEEVLVAAGKPAVPGRDGRIQFYFDTEQRIKPRVREDGSVDFHDLSLVQNVTRGQELARVIPHTAGEFGRDVFLEPIFPQSGGPAALIPGRNTSFADAERTVLKADVEGHVTLKSDNLICVDTVYTVPEDVDYSTGNIDVKAELFVGRDVRSGFKVRVGGDVIVRGTVEDAVIEAGGDVVVKGGFVGTGKGIIRAQGDVVLRFIQNQKVVAGGDIQVGEESLHADLKAGGAILMNKGKGTLIGGSAQAGSYTEFKCLGNEQGILTVLSVAESGETDREIEQHRVDIERLEGSLEEVIHKMIGIQNQVYYSGWLPQLKGQHRKYEERLHELTVKRNALVEGVDKLQRSLKTSRNRAYIRILKAVYPGVRVKLGGITKRVEAELGPLTFRINRGELITVTR